MRSHRNLFSVIIALTILLTLAAPAGNIVLADTNTKEVRITGPSLEDKEFGSAASSLLSPYVTYPYADSGGNRPFGVHVTVQIYQGGEWADYGQSTFSEGTYRLKLNVFTSSDCETRYSFSSKPTILYNGTECTVSEWQKYSAIAYTTQTFNIVPIEYELVVAGTTVTSSNADNILGNGVFRYNADTKTLTVNGNCTYSNIIIHNKGINGLNINVAGDSTLTGTGIGACITIQGDTHITGEGKLVLKHNNYAAISAVGNASLEIYDADIEATAKTHGISYYSVSGSRRKLTVTNSNLTVTGEDDAISNFLNGIDFSGCSITVPSDYKIIDGTVYYADGTTKAKTVTIKLNEYNLWIAGVRVTGKNQTNILAGTAQGDKGFSYDPGTKTLTVSKSIMSSTAIINSQINGLTVKLEGDIAFAGGTALTTSGASTTITGGSLYCNSVSSYPISISYGGTLTLKDTVVTGSMTGNGHPTKLVIDNSDVVAPNGIVNFGGGITLKGDREVITPTDAVVGTSVFNSDGETKATDVTIAAPYDLQIAGTTVTTLNASDVLGDGVFSYDAASKTLTVNGNCTYTKGLHVIDSKIDGLTIDVAGDSVLKTSGMAVMLSADTIICGAGRLSLVAGYIGLYVTSGAALTITDADIYADGDDYGIAGNPSGETLDVINSYITASGPRGALCDFEEITLDGSEVVSPEGAVNNGNSICASDGTTKASSVTIFKTLPVKIKSVSYNAGSLAVKAENITPDTLNAIVLAAFYDASDNFISAKLTHKSLTSGDNSFNLAGTSVTGAKAVKLLVWSADSNMTPLAYAYRKAI